MPQIPNRNCSCLNALYIQDRTSITDIPRRLLQAQFQIITIKWILQNSESDEILVSPHTQKLCLHYTAVYEVCNTLLSLKIVYTLIKNTLLLKMLTIIWQHKVATNHQAVKKKKVSAKCNKAKCSKVRPYFIKASDDFSSNKFKERLEAFLWPPYTYSLKTKTKKQEQRGNLHPSITYFY